MTDMQAGINETQAVVTALDGNYALVRTEAGGCGRCHEAGGCGGANISQMLCNNERTWRVLNPHGAKVGELVRVAVADGALSSGAMLIYVLPLSCFIGGALFGVSLFAETGAIVGAGAGLALAWLVVSRRARQRRCDPRFHPHIL